MLSKAKMLPHTRRALRFSAWRSFCYFSNLAEVISPVSNCTQQSGIIIAGTFLAHCLPFLSAHHTHIVLAIAAFCTLSSPAFCQCCFVWNVQLQQGCQDMEGHEQDFRLWLGRATALQKNLHPRGCIVDMCGIGVAFVLQHEQRSLYGFRCRRRNYSDHVAGKPRTIVASIMAASS
jgi:hypothetical protein